MASIIPTDNLIDEICLLKNEAANKMRQVIDKADECADGKMTRTASGGQIDGDSLLKLFTAMLSALNMTASDKDVKNVIGSITKSAENLEKEASIEKSGREKSSTIKIVSKAVKDSHYKVDISKDVVKHNGKEVLMVSCYAKDAYLGRYLIKRNYFYTLDREKFANSSYDEIMTKVGAIKDRYYNEVIDVSGIFTQIKQVLDGVVSEIEIKEDSVGNISR